MGVVNLNVSLRLSPTQRTFIPFENINTEMSFTDFKKEIIKKGNLEQSCELELIYGCRTLNKESNLAALEVGPCVKIIYAILSKPVLKTPEPKKLSSADQYQLQMSFRAAATNPQFHQTLQNISKPETLKYLLSKVPGLSEDQVALSMLHDWELILHLADPKLIKSLVESHPALVDALHQLVNSGEGYNDLVRHRVQSGRLARSLGADLDDNMEQEAPQQPQRSNIPPPTSNSLTPEMFSQALLHAMSSMGNPPPPPSRRADDFNNLRQQFSHHLPEMRELGITDDSASLRALQMSNGDVEAAVNLFFAGLIDD